MANVDWYIEGTEFGNCNCDYGCPSQFEALPTHGNCTGFEVVHLDKGHFSDVDLAPRAPQELQPLHGGGQGEAVELRDLYTRPHAP